MEASMPSKPTKDDEASKFEAFCQHLKSCTWDRPTCADPYPWHGFNISENTEMYLEEMRKHKQARLALQLRNINQKRLLMGYNPSTGKMLQEEDKPVVFEKLKREKQDNVIKLKDVKLIYPKDVGASIGTLDTHVNGFLYTTTKRSSFHLHCMFKDIKDSFYRLTDDCSGSHLLHFHLDTDIKVGKTKTTKDILFRLVLSPDSEEEEKKKHEDRNKDLEGFVSDVEFKWSRLYDLGPIERMLEKDSFMGFLISKGPALFYLTSFSIFGNIMDPAMSFVVVSIEDIEIVNLARFDYKTFHMTVILEDFKVDSMLEVQFSFEFLHVIKDWLCRRGVKYYENQVMDWKPRVKKITEDFQNFLERGGWVQFEVEDNAPTPDYYMESEDSDEDYYRKSMQQLNLQDNAATIQGGTSPDYTSDSTWEESCSESESEEEE